MFKRRIVAAICSGYMAMPVSAASAADTTAVPDARNTPTGAVVPARTPGPSALGLGTTADDARNTPTGTVPGGTPGTSALSLGTTAAPDARNTPTGAVVPARTP